jgi:AraC-like DNA-binding protein
MIYTQFNPHPALSNYIDAYWTVEGEGNGLEAERILPDGCVDIILNLGAACKTDNGNFLMENEKAYLVGTMTRLKEANLSRDAKLLGIRFKPGAFSFFYKFSSLHEVKDITIEFDKVLSPDLKKAIRYPIEYFNHFLLDRLSRPKHTLLPVINDIQNHKGQMDVKTLAGQHFTTVRQLERSFKQHIGASPKELISLIRYQLVHSAIENNTTNRSLLDIAFEYGYYDHSHLTNEFKRYTGIAPSGF